MVFSLGNIFVGIRVRWCSNLAQGTDFVCVSLSSHLGHCLQILSAKQNLSYYNKYWTWLWKALTKKLASQLIFLHKIKILGGGETTIHSYSIFTGRLRQVLPIIVSRETTTVQSSDFPECLSWFPPTTVALTGQFWPNLTVGEAWDTDLPTGLWKISSCLEKVPNLP